MYFIPQIEYSNHGATCLLSCKSMQYNLQGIRIETNFVALPMFWLRKSNTAQKHHWNSNRNASTRVQSASRASPVRTWGFRVAGAPVAFSFLSLPWRNQSLGIYEMTTITWLSTVKSLLSVPLSPTSLKDEQNKICDDFQHNWLAFFFSRIRTSLITIL